MSAFAGYVTPREAAVLINKSHGQVCRYVRMALLPAKRVGQNILIPEKALKDFDPPPPGNPNFQKKKRS